MPYTGLPIFASLLYVLGFYTEHTAAYTPQDAPYQNQPGQSGYNQCGTGYNQSSECQNVYGTFPLETSANLFHVFTADHRHLTAISQHSSGFLLVGTTIPRFDRG